MSGKKPDGLLFVLLALFIAFPTSLLADPVNQRTMMRSAAEFEQQFDQFCLNVDLDALDAFENLQATLDQLLEMFTALKDLEFSLNFDPQQCISGGFDYDIPEIPDVTGCFGGLEIPSCDFGNLPNVNDVVSCVQSSLGDFDPQDFFDLDFDIGDLSCFLEGLNIPDLDDIAGILGGFSDILGGFDAYIDLLKDFEAAFDPEFLLNLRGLAEFCDQDLSGYIPPAGSSRGINPIAAINKCGGKKKKAKRRRCYEKQHDIEVPW